MAYYATASRRKEGRARLDIILQHVRTLQSHALSTSSSSLVSPINNIRDDEKNVNHELLQSILQIPMSDITQTDMRLLSQEIDDILKRIDHVREIICPKDKFVFKRYRRAMEEMSRSGQNGHCSPPPTGAAIVKAKAKNESHADREDGVKDRRGGGSLSNYGGVLENMSNCTIEVSSDGTVLVDRVGEETLRYYGAPRPANALHPPYIIDSGGQKRPSQPAISRDSSSYLLRNLNNVVVLVHGSRPSLHLQHVRKCKIYASEPTLGAVHVTDCHSSVIRCSCYQLRVHDSRDVKFDVWTRSGPIIEDCIGMEFSGNYYRSGRGAEGGGSGEYVPGDGVDGPMIVGRNMFWDVKDFNWLRALRQSPNFVVVAMSTANDDEAVCIEAPVANTIDIVPSEGCADLSSSIIEGEDSEDEL
ncbi:hypothetical protein ACHAXA_005843 [Cyclostephanos tholiformis]|uniref:C-CAP/cofactor C-like domain-containing protein n=1 Tax=Cyclostephanos tholiformis TaxID=382380 RepID=A0ABD3RWB9_9STRA